MQTTEKSPSPSIIDEKRLIDKLQDLSKGAPVCTSYKLDGEFDQQKGGS